MVSEFHFQSLVDTVDALRSGHLPAVTLARQMLRRIQSAEALAAYVSVDSEAVLARATALDGQRARGEPLGRLHGIPLALKDLVDQAGKVTGAGGTVHGAEEARRKRELKRSATNDEARAWVATRHARERACAPAGGPAPAR